MYNLGPSSSQSVRRPLTPSASSKAVQHIVLANFAGTEYPLPYPPGVAVKAGRAKIINFKFDKKSHSSPVEQGCDCKRDGLEMKYLILSFPRSGKVATNRSVLMGMGCLNTRFPGSLCLPYCVRNTA